MHAANQQLDMLRRDDPSNPHALASVDDARRFIFAGHALFTIRSTKTSVRYTFKLSRPRHCRRCASGDEPCSCEPRRFFASFLTGPENESDYTYLGMVEGGSLRLTQASKMREDSLPVVALSFVLRNLARDRMPPDCEIWHEGRCGRCGRTLTVPESIENGIGPECAKRMQ